MAASDNPELTSGKANFTAEYLRFPISENPAMTTAMRFVKYDRLATEPDYREETTATIILPLPYSIPDRMSIRTSGVDLGTIGGALNYANIDKFKNMGSGGISGIFDQFSKGYDAFMDRVKSEGSVKGVALTAAALAPLVPDGIKNIGEIYAGVVRNPHSTVYFDGVNLKSFNLTWRMSARSREESDAIQKIIETIKERIHPEEFLNGMALNYPDLVYVEFRGPSKDYLPKFQRAFVNDVSLTIGGGNMAFYKSGAPVEVELMMSFTELNIVTRKTLEKQHGKAIT